MHTKVTLDTGKTVILRGILISDQETAARNTKGGDNAALTAVQLQSELLKLMIVKINDKTVKGSDKERLDNIFTFPEYSQLCKVIQELMGNPKMPSIETVKDTSK